MLPTLTEVFYRRVVCKGVHPCSAHECLLCTHTLPMPRYAKLNKPNTCRGSLERDTCVEHAAHGA